jgi:uncharacterized protein
MNCARIGTSCCTHYQIILTTGDIQRIFDFLGHQDFFTLEPPVLEDIEPDYDPLWMPLILKPEGVVCVIKRTQEKSCALLTETGCSLPYDCRPLICRLYPYQYTEEGVLGIDKDCPISVEKEWGGALDTLDMTIDKAKQWISLLYAEVRNEIKPRPETLP